MPISSSLLSLRLKRHRKHFIIATISVLTIIVALSFTLPAMFRFTPACNNLRSAIASKSRPTITLRQGFFCGITAQSPSLPQPIEQFLGIPYGDSVRFKPPTRVRDSNQEFDASSYGNRCPAGPGGAYGEDCLNVNIFRPQNRENGTKLPVVVYIHGGAFNSGFGNVRDIASFIAWSAVPIIGVSFNYRTGAFGFLPVKEEGVGVLNLGLRDQRLALQWVQENIGEFGGDEKRVTLMGSSAGAHSIGHLLMLGEEEDGKQLFHRVILESGAATARACYRPDHELPVEQLNDFLRSLGFEDVPPEEVVEKLRSLKMDVVKRASDALFDKYNPSVRWPFQPVIDGEGGMISQAPIESWKGGKWKKVPILTGFNTNEGAMFVPEMIETSEEFTAFFRTLLPKLTEQNLVELERLYPDPAIDPDSKYRETRQWLGAQFKRTEQAYGHFAYVAPVRQTVHFASAAEPPTYLYHFAASSSLKGGADHGTQSFFVVHGEDRRRVSETVEHISGTMHAYWSSFVATGDPNAIKGARYGDRPVWKRYVAGDEGKIMVFGEGNDEVAGGKEKGVVVQIRKDDELVKESDFWWARTEKSDR